MADHVPAAVRYKEITAAAESAAQRLREHEAAKAAKLGEEAPAARKRAEEADEHCAKVTAEANKLWNMAMDALWKEKWLQVPEMPTADTSSKPAAATKAIKAMEAAYRELSAMIDQPSGFTGGLLARRRREH